MAMKLVKKTAEYSIYQRGDNRYAVKDANRKSVNAEEKVRILVTEGLITVPLPQEPAMEEAAEEGAVAEEAAAGEEVAEEASAAAEEEPAAEAVETAPAEAAPAAEEAPAGAEEAPAEEETEEEEEK